MAALREAGCRCLFVLFGAGAFTPWQRACHPFGDFGRLARGRAGARGLGVQTRRAATPRSAVVAGKKDFGIGWPSNIVEGVMRVFGNHSLKLSSLAEISLPITRVGAHAGIRARRAPRSRRGEQIIADRHLLQSARGYHALVDCLRSGRKTMTTPFALRQLRDTRCVKGVPRALINKRGARHSRRHRWRAQHVGAHHHPGPPPPGYHHRRCLSVA